LIAQLVLVLVQQLVQARLLVQELQQVQVLVQELQQVQVQVLVQVQLPVLASHLVQHPPHQQLQSLFQRQRSRLLQHEFLSILRQLAKALQYQLCL
jgi:hypothetical protein